MLCPWFVERWPELEDRVAALFPGAHSISVIPLATDEAGAGTAAKGSGYGVPRRVTFIDGAGVSRSIVFRTASANDFGHDRRSDRAQGILLAWDTFGRLDRHVVPLDVGAIGADGRLDSLAGCGELYLITTWAPGTLYAADLRRVAEEEVATPLDERRCEALARWLVAVHAQPGSRPESYTRSIRDLVGHGEGIFGIIDGYPEDVPGAPPDRLRAIERRCVEWRWRLRGREDRVRRIHGDFHPFNVVFDRDEDFQVLDSSRGGEGDPADDVACMAINYLFFALERRRAWRRGLGPLWYRFWRAYYDGTRDAGLFRSVAPFFAWRGLVLANPRFYPRLGAAARGSLLAFVEQVLEAPSFAPEGAEGLFR
jgi:hypothetical protein